MFRPKDEAVSQHEQAVRDCAQLAHDENQKQVMLRFIQEASPDSDPNNLQLFGLLMKIRPLLIQTTERDLAASGLSWAKLRMLLYLTRQEQLGEDGALPSELSEMQEVSRNTVSALINGLEAEGMITRQLHSSDRRKLVIRLTPKGREVLHANLAQHVQLVNRCFDALNPQERDTLFTLLSRLEKKLKGEAADEPCPPTRKEQP